jgi:glyoxylase I family protein
VSFQHVLAVIPVSDIEASRAWYEKLIGRAPDNHPMPVLYEWQVVPGGWLQIWADTERPGSGLANFAVDDLDAHVAAATDNGLAPEATEDVNKGVRLCTLADPDGNLIRLIGGFRVEY